MEHPQFRRGFVFCGDCFVFRVCSGGILGLQAVKALLGSISTKDINSSNLKF